MQSVFTMMELINVCRRFEDGITLKSHGILVTVENVLQTIPKRIEQASARGRLVNGLTLSADEITNQCQDELKA